MGKYQKKPDWLTIKVRNTHELTDVEEILKKLSLRTVCEEANCPNKMECFSKKTATFMILGSICTRNCTFCNVNKEMPGRIDREEPKNVARAVKEFGLKHVVITSVTRDDLPDGGSGHFAEVIEEVKILNRDVTVEVLIPDFKGDRNALKKVVDAKPQIINHNIETVPRLYPEVRPMAVYDRSLELLANVKTIQQSIYTKSGIMLGLGEIEEEVMQVLKSLRHVKCDFLTIGQYLAPSGKHHPVVSYIHPDKFEEYKSKSLAMGFKYVASGPLVRSSYQTEKVFEYSSG